MQLREISIGLVVLLVTGLLSPQAMAQRTQQKNPPVAISGFKYQYYPSRHLHMNFCRAKSCVRGSKVSYVFYAPSPNPSFASYQKQRRKVEAALKSALAGKLVLKFGKLKESRDKLFTIFDAPRVQTAADGTKTHVITTVIFSRKFTVELISSASRQKTAENNRALFMLALLVKSGVQSRP